MADVFNQNPTEYVDLNTMFPVLNEKVGLTYEQWRKAIENTNFLKNNLGVGDVERGDVKIQVVDDDSLVGLDVTTREVIVERNGVQRTVIYLDFDLRIPAGNVQSVNGKSGVVELDSEDVNAVARNRSLSIGNGNAQIIVDTEVNSSSKSNRFYVNSTQVMHPVQNDAFEFEVINSGVYFNSKKLSTEEYVNNSIQQSILDSWEASY